MPIDDPEYKGWQIRSTRTSVRWKAWAFVQGKHRTHWLMVINFKLQERALIAIRRKVDNYWRTHPGERMEQLDVK